MISYAAGNATREKRSQGSVWCWRRPPRERAKSVCPECSLNEAEQRVLL